MAFILLSDLVIANGNSLMLFRSSINESMNIPVTKPQKNQKIVSVVADAEKDLVYFSIVRRNSSSIGIYNLVDNRTDEIYTSKQIILEYMSRNWWTDFIILKCIYVIHLCLFYFKRFKRVDWELDLS